MFRKFNRIFNQSIQSRLNANQVKYFTSELNNATFTNSQEELPNLGLKTQSRVMTFNQVILPYGSKKKIHLNPLISEVWKKGINYPSMKLSVFFKNPKTQFVLPVGTYAEITKIEEDRYVLSPLETDSRVLLNKPENKEYNGDPLEIEEINDDASEYQVIDNPLSANIIQELNNALKILHDFSTKSFFIDQNTIKELDNVFIIVQDILAKTGFVSAKSTPFNKEGVNFTLSKVVFLLFDSFINMHHNMKGNYPVQEIQTIMKCTNPCIRARLLIEFIYDIADGIIKDVHMNNEYKKDSMQKHEKMFFRFAHKKIEKILSNETQEEYLKRLQSLELLDQTRKAIANEISHAFASISTNSDGFDQDERKKTFIVEEIFNFPWNKRQPIEFDIPHSMKVFEENLFGLEKVKERVYEYIAKLKRTHKSKKGFIILIHGPPGTGKTSIANLIGAALKRKTKLINFSGENDIVQLKGIKRTYVDSGPSVFFKEMVKLQVKNPVIVLDEIDKIGSDWRGGNAQNALLEILNPEENHNFIDHYLNVPLDFSECIFVCTANNIHNILEPLLDRVEIIKVDSYTDFEKLEIAKKYILPKLYRDFEFDDSTLKQVNISDDIIKYLIKNYSFNDSGVRGLSRNIQTILEKANLELLTNSDPNFKINEETVVKYLGSSRIDSNYKVIINTHIPEGSLLVTDIHGYITRLAVNTKNQEILEDYLNIHSKDEKLKKMSKNSDDILSKFTTSGFIGDVIKESFTLAKSLAARRVEGIISKNEYLHTFLNQKQYLLSFSLPYQKKDDNSYGLGLYLAIVSAVLKLPIKRNYVILGEISTIGHVFSIRGLIYHIDICFKNNIDNLILPLGNKEEFEALNQEIRSKIKYVHFVRNVNEAEEIVFTGMLAKIEEIKNIKSISDCRVFI